MKVAFIHPDLGIGGAERLVLDVAIALVKEENEVVFITNHFDKSHAFKELSDGVYRIRVIGDWIPRGICGICQAFFTYLRMLYLTLVYMLFICRKDEPDIYFVDQIPMAVPLIKLFGYKVIYYCHHPDLLASPQGGVMKKIYRLPINWLEFRGTEKADIILVNSKYTASVFSQTFPGITKRIQILYPTISASFQVAVENAKSNKDIGEIVPELEMTNRNSVVYLSINRFHPAKKLEFAIEAFEVLRNHLSVEDWNNVYLIMAGGFDPQSSINAKYFDELVNLTHTKNLTRQLIFIKSPSDAMKVDLLLLCQCLIYTPINEHFGIVPLEAMSAAKPVIAINSGGPCETIQHELTGYLCDPTAESIAENMCKILNKSESEQLGRNGKLRLEQYFSQNSFGNSVNGIFKEFALK